MIKLSCIFFILFFCACCFPKGLYAQEEERYEVYEQKVEATTEDDLEEAPSVDVLRNLWEQARKKPYSINTVQREELESLQLLSPLQCNYFFEYRRLLGDFLSIYELQSIPGWNLETIRNLLPYLTIETPFRMSGNVVSSLSKGTHSLLFRTGGSLETLRYSRWRTLPGDQGNPLRTLLKYQYQSSPFLELGFTGEKDAGERLFNAKGFDFNSLHLFAKKLGKIKALALGDYTVSMGQGLIQWQGMAFHKSVAIAQIKRQGPVLAPYRSSGEFGFQRGAGVTISLGKWEWSLFGSIKPLDARLEIDTINGRNIIRSFLSSGYHASSEELITRHNARETSFGSVLVLKGSKGSWGLNMMGYDFSHEIKREEAPYRLFAVQGKTWGNVSMDYSFGWKSIHWFGEWAMDLKKRMAAVSGLLWSPDPKMDLTLLGRILAGGYQSLYGNAFTENSLPGNENGFFAGTTLRPLYRWEINAYFDVFRFPWLRYRLDQPGEGSEFLVQVAYKPSRNVEVYGRFKSEKKSLNKSGAEVSFHEVTSTIKRQFRLQVEQRLSKQLENRARAELLWMKDSLQARPLPGYLLYAETRYLFSTGGSLGGRVQYFETEGYGSRIYAFENDLPFGYSVPAFYEKGIRIYFTLHKDFSLRGKLKPFQKIQCWFKYGRTLKMQPTAESNVGAEEFRRISSEFRLQCQLHW